MPWTAEAVAAPLGDTPLAAALAQLRAGGLVAYPTETVWGLAALANCEPAVAQLFAWKHREAAQPVSLLVAGSDSLARLGFAPGPAALRLMRHFWPGPLSLVLPRVSPQRIPPRRRLAAGIARSDGAVGFRCSAHPLAAGLAARLEAEGLGPITATSLNHSGQPPARQRGEAEALCRAASPGGEAIVLTPGEAGGAPPSSVVDLSGAAPRVLRWGAPERALLEPQLLQSMAGPDRSRGDCA